MKKRVFALVTALLLAAALLCAGISAFDANDYSYGGGGGGGGSSYSYSGDGDHGGDLTSLLLAIVVVAVMCVYWAIKDKIDKHKKKKDPGAPAAPQAPLKQPKVVPANDGEGLSVPIPNRTADIRDILKQSEPSFSEQAIIGSAVKLFADIRGAVCARNVDALRSAVTGKVFDELYAYIRHLSDKHLTEHCEGLSVTNSYLTSLVRESGSESLTVYLGAQYVCYLTDDDTGDIFEGDTETVWSYRWLMTFTRSAGAETYEPGKCPHCGAPVNMTSPGRCEYCGGAVTAGGPEWTLRELATVRDETKDNGIRV